MLIFSVWRIAKESDADTALAFDQDWDGLVEMFKKTANDKAGGSYASTLDNGASRVEFWNSRAAWFATVYARLAQMGVAAMGASQFFGFDTATAEKFGWLGVKSAESFCEVG